MAQPQIVFTTTCKGRAAHVQDTLPRNLADNPNSRFVLLDYSSRDGLVDYLLTAHGRDIHDGRLTIYSFPTAPVFRMGHAKNMAARCAMLEGADILVTMDADNATRPGFDALVAAHLTEPRVYLAPDFPRIKSLPHGPGRPQRGYAGRLAIRRQDFLKLGGYDETFDTWRGEDIDLIARMQRIGDFQMDIIPTRYLEAIPHNSKVRFREYPHAQQYETKQEYRNIYDRTETVVNFGQIGCGVVYRNFHYDEPIQLNPLPTRVFGIGMHKTATTSLHDAFKILGYDSFHWETNRKAFVIWQEIRNLGRSPLLERYQTFCDNPFPLVYKELDRAYPGSKFILTTRSLENWLGSVKGLYNPSVNPHYDWDRQPWTHPIHEALYGRRDFDATTMVNRYVAHNNEVLDYFRDRPQDLLVMRMDDGAGWPDLCQFLDAPIPREPYPRSYSLY